MDGTAYLDHSDLLTIASDGETITIRIPTSGPPSEPEARRNEARPIKSVTGVHSHQLPEKVQLPSVRRRRVAGVSPRIGYERFKRSKLGICSWNRYYRGCWHRICPPVETRAGI